MRGEGGQEKLDKTTKRQTTTRQRQAKTNTTRKGPNKTRPKQIE